MIIAVGYRVDSKQATKFRKMVAQIITDFTTKGIVVNQDRITLEGLVKTLRNLRNEKKSFYVTIKDVFESALDYDIAPHKQQQKFFFFIQDKFLFAVVEKNRLSN